MNSVSRTLAVLCALAFVVAPIACSTPTLEELETEALRACDDAHGCLDGYTCVDGHCVKSGCPKARSRAAGSASPSARPGRSATLRASA